MRLSSRLYPKLHIIKFNIIKICAETNTITSHMPMFFSFILAATKLVSEQLKNKRYIFEYKKNSIFKKGNLS